MDISTLVSNELCTGCGICLTESKDGRMVLNENGFLVPDIQSVFSDKAIKLCPFNPHPDAEVSDEDKLGNLFLREAERRDKDVGKYIDTYVGYANEYRKTSSSGGLATYIFSELLKRNIVEAVYIVKEVKGKYSYQLIKSIDGVKSGSKTKYTPVTLSEFFVQINELKGKVAVSGVGCFIKAIRLKQYYNPEYKIKIPFTVGIICGGLKSVFFSDYMAQVSGIEGDYFKQDYRIKDESSVASDYSFGAFDEKGEFFQTKMSSVGDMWGTGLFKSFACDFCTDVTTELADISLGDAWVDPYKNEGLGNSVIVTRSTLADNIIKEGIESGELSVSPLEFNVFLKSQKGSFNHRHTGLKYRVKKTKRAGRFLPYVRKRYLKSINLEFQLVQKRRMKIRRDSLEIWRSTLNHIDFDLRIANRRKDLIKYTVMYHRIGRIRTLFNRKKE